MGTPILARVAKPTLTCCRQCVLDQTQTYWFCVISMYRRLISVTLARWFILPRHWLHRPKADKIRKYMHRPTKCSKHSTDKIFSSEYSYDKMLFEGDPLALTLHRSTFSGSQASMWRRGVSSNSVGGVTSKNVPLVHSLASLIVNHRLWLLLCWWSLSVLVFFDSLYLHYTELLCWGGTLI